MRRLRATATADSNGGRRRRTTSADSNGGWLMRIALVTEYYYPHLGGVCEHVHHFAREARALGHDVDIITSCIPDSGAAPPHVIRLGRSVPWYINGSQSRITVGRSLRARMRAVLREGRYDLVHVHSPLTPVLPMLAVEESPVPVVGTFHTYFERSLGYRCFRRRFQSLLDRLSAAIAVSPSTVVALERYFDADWRIIPNGVDASLFSPEAALPRPDGMVADRPVILFLGRFDPRNGLSTLIDAFKRVKARGHRAQLVVVGDGPLRSIYRRQAAGDPDIVFVGPVLHGRPAYYLHSTMYACPTTKASFGITLLEAMACGVPIVCSDILGFRDVVQHGREAVMVPRGDADALANGMARLLDDRGARERLGRTGRRRALEYDWRIVTSAVLEVYRDVLGAPVAAAL
jgi:phosphatidylinositol alpha-mannosyltransferase